MCNGVLRCNEMCKVENLQHPTPKNTTKRHHYDLEFQVILLAEFITLPTIAPNRTIMKMGLIYISIMN